MELFMSFQGRVTTIDDFWTEDPENVGCNKFISLENREGDTVNFVITPSTYFVDHVMVSVGDWITGFYDANAPTPMIFPPQFRALVMAKMRRDQFVKVDYFNRRLVSGDGTLLLTPTPTTPMELENGQRFTGDPGNRNLIVIYGRTTRSIPAQTTPYKIIVMCPK